MLVIHRFHVALKQEPGWVALYSVIEEGGERRLRWDGIRSEKRIPPKYAAALQTTARASSTVDRGTR